MHKNTLEGPLDATGKEVVPPAWGNVFAVAGFHRLAPTGSSKETIYTVPKKEWPRCRQTSHTVVDKKILFPEIQFFQEESTFSQVHQRRQQAAGKRFSSTCLPANLLFPLSAH